MCYYLVKDKGDNMNEKYYNYNDLEQMQEKAKKIDSEPDKKNFLKTLTPLEQKMALFYSKRPYDIINYLDTLNSKETNIMLNELNDEEISKLLEQFTAEDKKSFYRTFSNSILVNKFISNDKQAFTHVDELDLERKIELLDSSKVATEKATEKIYDSLSTDEKKEVETKITSTEGSLVVDKVIESDENNLENTMEEVLEEQDVKLQQQEEQNEETQEEKSEEKEQQENQEEQKEEIQEEKFKEINNFLKSRLEYYKQQNPKFNDIDIATPNLFDSLSEELKEIVNNDFNLLTNEQKDKLNNTEDKENLLNEFQKSKEDCESEIINNIKQINKVNEEELTNEQSYVKTI